MALPTLTLLDSFKRANESPLSNGGKWAKLLATLTQGLVQGEAWGTKEAFSKGEEGAYWTPAEFTNPAVALTFNTLYGTGERYCALWACAANPASLELNGYRVRMVEPATGGTAGKEATIIVERVVKGVGTTILTLTKQNWTNGSKVAVQVTGGKVIMWKEDGAGWTVVGEVADSTYTKGFVGMGGRGNIGRLGPIEAGETVGAHEHTLSATQGSSPVRAVAAARTLSVTQGQAAAKTGGVPKALSTTQAQAIQRTATPGKSLTSTQAQAITRKTGVGKVFGLTQASSYGPQLPSTPLTDELETELGFNSGATWTVLAWAEAIGGVYQRNKGLAGKPKPVGWGGTELKKLGARYNAASFADPINSMMIRESDNSEAARYAAIGICAPSNGERSGYVARIESQGEGLAYKVFLERWVNGAKTVLAETTIATGYFGASSTFKEAPFALTLVGGVLRLWLAASGAPTVLLSATDTTSASGYNTMESVGKWMLSQEHAATMDGQIAMTGQGSKGQPLSTTQGSAITRAPTQIARTLSLGVTQVPSKSVALARSLGVAQPSSGQIARAASHSFAATQGQAATRRETVARALSATQGSAPSVRILAARALVAANGASAAFVRAIARTLRVSQPQAASQEGGLEPGIHDHPHTLSAGQGSSATLPRSLARALSAGQAQAASRQTALSRLLSASASAVARRTVALARSLRVTQGQAAAQEGVRSASLHTQEAAQGAAAGLSRALSRRLTAGQGSGAGFARAVSRTLASSGGATASVGRARPRTLSTSSTSLASLRRTQVTLRLSAMSSSSASISARVGRALNATQPSAASVSFGTIEVPLPPPVNMSASSTSTSADSEARAPTGENSLGQSRLTSSVESTT